MIKLYLAGAIFGKTKKEQSVWRNEVKKKLRDTAIYCVDPTEVEAADYLHIVPLDIAAIKECHCLLVYYPEPSTGTAMEMRIAWEMGKPIFVFPEMERRNLGTDFTHSPWTQYHATYIGPFDQCLARIIEFKTTVNL